VAEMPLNANGKVDRRALKERLPSLMGEASDAAGTH